MKTTQQIRRFNPCQGFTGKYFKSIENMSECEGRKKHNEKILQKEDSGFPHIYAMNK